MIFYNKAVFEAAGLDPENPPLSTYDEFLATAKTLVAKGGVKAAIWPSPTSEFFQPWFDFYPLFIAQSRGKQLVEKGQPQFNNADGLAVAAFWRSMYDAKLAPNEAYKGDSFADQKAAMAIVGPWAIAVYGDKVDWGAVPVPTKDGMAASEVHTFSDEKSIGHVHQLQEPWDGLGVPQVRDEQGERRPAARDDRPDADARRRRGQLPGLLRGEPRVRGVRRPGQPDGRGADRPELDRDVADVPDGLQRVGDLRQDADR